MQINTLFVLMYTMLRKQDSEKAPAKKYIKLLPYCGSPTINQNGRCQIPQINATTVVAFNADILRRSLDSNTPRHPISSNPPPMIIVGRMAKIDQIEFVRNGPLSFWIDLLMNHAEPLNISGENMINEYHVKFTLKRRISDCSKL
jgi:hypothetical protein